MPDLKIGEYQHYDAFAGEWHADDPTPNEETESQLIWQLLGQLAEDELLIRIPSWLAEEKIGYVDGGIPTEFVGRIDRESAKAILFADSAAAPQLMKLAHRIHKLESGIKETASDESHNEWLEDRLRENRDAFETREDVTMLAEEWLPKSQIEAAVRRKK